jgi:hypothetical protein
MSFSPEGKIASSREKKSGENDGSSWCPFLCVSNYVGSRNVSLENVRWVLTFITTLVFVCPWTRIYCKFSFITATDFLTSAEFPHGGKHHEQNLNLDLPPRKATGSSFFFGLLLINIVRNTYTAIHRNRGAIFFTLPPPPGGLALQPELLESALPFSDPT